MFRILARTHLGVALALGLAVILLVTSALPALAQQGGTRRRGGGGAAQPPAYCAEFPGALECGALAPPSGSPDGDGSGPCDMFRGWSGCEPERDQAPQQRRRTTVPGMPPMMPGEGMPAPGMGGAPPMEGLGGSPPPRHLGGSPPPERLGGAEPGLTPMLAAERAMGAGRPTLDAPLFLHPAVPEAKRQAMQLAYLGYMKGRLALMQAVADARVALQDTLAAFPLDAAKAAQRSRALAEAWSAELNAKAAYAAELQAILGEALWRTLLESPLSSFGLEDTGAGNR